MPDHLVPYLVAFLLGALVTWLLMRVPRTKDADGTELAGPIDEVGDLADVAEMADVGQKQPVRPAERPSFTSVDVDDEPYGTGSASPKTDGSAPSAAYTVKGNADTMLYYTPDSPDFDETKAEVWFKTAAYAEKAGFTAWDAQSPRNLTE